MTTIRDRPLPSTISDLPPRVKNRAPYLRNAFRFSATTPCNLRGRLHRPKQPNIPLASHVLSVSGIATATYTVIMPSLALGSKGAPPRWQYPSRSLTTLRSKKQGHRCPRLEGIIHEGVSFLSPDCSGNSTGVRIRSFASYTLTWICGYFFLSSKPAFIASSEVTYSVLNFPSISRT